MTPGDSGDAGWESEQRTRGRMERRGAPWHRDTNARTGASGAKTQTSERRGRGGRGRGVPAPRVPLYTVGGARRPLLPVLKYCSLTDMALTMGPEMRGGGSPPTPRCRGTPGSPGGPPSPTTGDGGAAGRAPGFVLWAWPRAGGGKGDGSVGDEGRRAQAYWGPLGEQKGQGRGHEEPPRGGQ